MNPAYANDLECDLTGHPEISYKWVCAGCEADGSRSTIPANSGQDGHEEVITCTGMVNGEFNQLMKETTHIIGYNIDGNGTWKISLELKLLS